MHKLEVEDDEGHLHEVYSTNPRFTQKSTSFPQCAKEDANCPAANHNNAIQMDNSKAKDDGDGDEDRVFSCETLRYLFIAVY